MCAPRDAAARCTGSGARLTYTGAVGDGQGKAVWAVGRHRAEPEVRRRGQRAGKRAAGPQRSTELLGWGIFIAATSAACLLWAEQPLAVMAGTPALLLAAFTAAWYGSRNSGLLQHPPGEGPEASPRAAAPVLPVPLDDAASLSPFQEPAKHVPAGSAAEKQNPQSALPVPAIPLAPGAAREFLNTPAPGPDGQASRWTRTFGPPDTGSLPLQPYLPAAHPPVKTADSDSHDRRQRSHSSL